MHKREIGAAHDSYGRVLVVDDLDANLFVAETFLERFNMKVDTAGSGAEAVAMVKVGLVFDIIFMDIHMPDMDGNEALASIREIGYKGPVVALTADAWEGRVNPAHKGFDDYIPKPLNPQKLSAVLEKFVKDKYGVSFE